MVLLFGKHQGGHVQLLNTFPSVPSLGFSQHSSMYQNSANLTRIVMVDSPFSTCGDNIRLAVILAILPTALLIVWCIWCWLVYHAWAVVSGKACPSMSNQQDAEGQYQTPVSPPDAQISTIPKRVRFAEDKVLEDIPEEEEEDIQYIDERWESPPSCIKFQNSSSPLGLDRWEGVENLALT